MQLRVQQTPDRACWLQKWELQDGLQMMTLNPPGDSMRESL